MSDCLTILSHRGQYIVTFEENALSLLNSSVSPDSHFIVDTKVAKLYAPQLSNVLTAPSVLKITATEENKSLDRFSGYVEHLVNHKIRRNHRLVAIGGGIVQDITCFLAATLLRGVEWHFYPTTLLAQADSCIGSKSSINVGQMKNIIGTFTPPNRIFISTHLLSTLSDVEVRSGIGEMLKVHAIRGPEAFDCIAADYHRLLTDEMVLQNYIYRSLVIKKVLIEEDEFDRGPRNVMNYGHSFGHAIESATSFRVPHGIAVTIGVDLANYVAVRLGLSEEKHYLRMHDVLRQNAAGFGHEAIVMATFFSALNKDKKNTGTALVLILPNMSGNPVRTSIEDTAQFREICLDYFNQSVD